MEIPGELSTLKNGSTKGAKEMKSKGLVVFFLGALLLWWTTGLDLQGQNAADVGRTVEEQNMLRAARRFKASIRTDNMLILSVPKHRTVGVSIQGLENVEAHRLEGGLTSGWR